MEIKLTQEEFKDRFTKLKSALVSGKDVTNYLIDDENKNVQICMGINGWNVQLNANGTWEIT